MPLKGILKGEEDMLKILLPQADQGPFNSSSSSTSPTLSLVGTTHSGPPLGTEMTTR